MSLASADQDGLISDLTFRPYLDNVSGEKNSSTSECIVRDEDGEGVEHVSSVFSVVLV